MRRKVVAVWVSLLIMISSIVILVEIADRVEAPTTLYVGGVGGGNYSKIQWAIDNASVGDTVYVYNGTYYEYVVVNKTINLTGENKDTTIIDGSGSGVVVLIEADWVNITGFTIFNSGSNSGDAGFRIESNYNYIYNNNASNNYYGVFLESTYWNNISSNLVSMNNRHGIYLLSSSNNTIINNKVTNNQIDGIKFQSSSQNLVLSNYISSNIWSGLYLYNSFEHDILNNNFSNDGIYIRGYLLSHYNSHTIPPNNNVNGKPLYYYKNSTNLLINGIPLGQLIITNCSNIDIKNLNINNTDLAILVAFTDEGIIANNNITFNKWGVHLDWTSKITIENNNISINVENGIDLYASYNNSMLNNTIILNDFFGISLLSSSNNYISNNNLSNKWYGIYIVGSSNNNTITYNVILGNVFGIYSFFSSNNIILNNNFSQNSGYGIYLELSSNNNIITNIISKSNIGIMLGSECNTNNITHNIITSNNWEGIYLYLSNNNSIVDNYEITNNGVGINLTLSSNNTIYHNNIINNTIQGFDNRNDNYWDNGYPSGGNYWSDYSGVDNFKGPIQDQSGSDGIGDTNYSIDSESIDNYPIMEPYSNKTFENYTILKQGWNLVSIPLIQNNQGLTKVLEMIDGYYDAIQWYDNTDPNDPWKHNKIGKPVGNDLFELNETMSFWIHITNPGDTIFLYNGTQPISNQTIQLYTGWNMLGYPSLSTHNRTVGMNNLTFDTHVDAIQWYDAASKTWHFMGPDDSFVPGRGYWVHSKVEVEWEVPL